MIKYSLCLYGAFQRSIEESLTSQEKFSASLLENFLKLKHINLRVVDFDWNTEYNPEKTFEKIPKSDFLLTSLYTLNVVNNGALAKESISRSRSVSSIKSSIIKVE